MQLMSHRHRFVGEIELDLLLRASRCNDTTDLVDYSLLMFKINENTELLADLCGKILQLVKRNEVSIISLREKLQVSPRIGHSIEKSYLSLDTFQREMCNIGFSFILEHKVGVVEGAGKYKYIKAKDALLHQEEMRLKAVNDLRSGGKKEWVNRMLHMNIESTLEIYPVSSDDFRFTIEVIFSLLIYLDLLCVMYI
jgi:hypothetical protein